MSCTLDNGIGVSFNYMGMCEQNLDILGATPFRNGFSGADLGMPEPPRPAVASVTVKF